jgi:hypothetical protein
LYIPGKRRLDGSHRPGRKLHRRQLLDGVAVGDQIARLGEVLEVQIRPLKRRWRGRRGGWSGYMSVEMFNRLVAWSATAMASSTRRSRRRKSTNPLTRQSTSAHASASVAGVHPPYGGGRARGDVGAASAASRQVNSSHVSQRPCSRPGDDGPRRLFPGASGGCSAQAAGL